MNKGESGGRGPQGPRAKTNLWWREAAGGATMNMQNC